MTLCSSVQGTRSASRRDSNPLQSEFTNRCRLFLPHPLTRFTHSQAIDQTRSAIQHIQSIIYTSPTLSQPHSHSHSHGSDETSNSSAHEEDFLALIVRVDRDLLDLYPMCWTLLKGLRSPGLPDWEKLAEGRVRRGLKAYAAYAKVSREYKWSVFF